MLKGYYDITPKEYNNIKVVSNYHSHNYLCGHAGGTVSDYVKEAVANDYEVIGISDHCLSPLGSSEPYVSPDTLHDRYLPQFDEARKLYGDKITILSAVEIEYFGGHEDHYKKLLDNLDYMVMGQHEYLYNGARKNSFTDGVDDDNISAYCDNVRAGIRTGMFAILAHPDLIFYRRPTLTKRMASALEGVVREAVDHGVALELNANGIRYHEFRYPTDLLIELCKKYNAEVVVSSDCHSPDVVCDEHVKHLYAYAKKNGLNLVDKLDLDRNR